jgi:glycosyltransferase involved in cell wall biosynthesis
MKNVLFVASVGVHINAFHLPFLEYFAVRGFEVHIAARFKAEIEGFREKGYHCHPIDFSRSPYSKDSLTAYRQLRNLLKENRFSLIHTHTPVASLLTRVLAYQTNQPIVIYTAHGFHVYRGAPLINRLFYGPAERLCAHWTDALITINHEDFEWAKRCLRLKNGANLYYVPGVGIEVSHYRSKPNPGLRESHKINDRAMIITVIAELNKNKNQTMVFNALKHLGNEEPIFLLLIGEGPMRSVYEKMVKERNLNNVHFLGYRKDIPDIIGMSDVIALTSRREGLPRSVMEGMAGGKPILGTNIRGIKDLVQDGKNGFLVDVDDVKGLAERIRLLYNKPELRIQMGHEGLEKIKEFSLERVMEEMDRIYTRSGVFE